MARVAEHFVALLQRARLHRHVESLLAALTDWERHRAPVSPPPAPRCAATQDVFQVPLVLVLEGGYEADVRLDRTECLALSKQY